MCDLSIDDTGLQPRCYDGTTRSIVLGPTGSCADSACMVIAGTPFERAGTGLFAMFSPGPPAATGNIDPVSYNLM